MGGAKFRITRGRPRYYTCIQRMASAPSNSRLEILPLEDGNDITCATFVFHGEDHTLGNALRWMLMKNPEVTFCGYSVPHPSEDKINLRIQTNNGVPAVEALRKALEDLKLLSEHIMGTFEQKVSSFKADMQNTKAEP